MPNIVPASEGLVSSEVFAGVVKEISDVVHPLMDGKLELTDAIQMSTEALGLVMVIRELPPDARVKVIAAAVAYIGAQVAQDLVVLYPSEEPPA